MALLGSTAVGALIAGSAWLPWPGAVWWLYASGGAIVAALLYTQLVGHLANVALMDRDRRRLP